ncbi:ABC transporter permease [Salaquimonas pukyongi]|uniref:ABC transporter permease n=1 Tax=Salaquimonas pukyongi TaxID=2712698 RepID=UPI00096B6EFC|nr:ABC transporter permease [Salaquimonas pukyongi]
MYYSLLTFLIRYRRTALGPLWLLVGPALFVIALGALFAEVGAVDISVFLPHLAIGLVTWTLINGYITGAATVFQRNRAQLLQGGMAQEDIVRTEVILGLLAFAHQILVVAGVFLYFGMFPPPYALLSLVGIGLLIANGIWTIKVFGTIGARYRDLAEIFGAVMGIFFLATPIIWMPGDGMGRSVMGVFQTYNPFYHFLELVRAPLLGNTISLLSWIVVITITILGHMLAWYFDKRYARFVPLWV